MAEKQIIFRDNQELQADDFLSQQNWQTESLDHVVLDAIHPSKAYWGFNITKAAATTLKTSQGRLYDAGMVYAREDEVSIDLYNQLPVSARKWFAVVAWGQTVDEDIQPRNFLIDADTGMAEPQSVAMQKTRYCNVSTVAGTESADPQQPSVGATYTALGYVLCDPTGIIGVQQSLTAQLDNLALVGASLRALMAWRSTVDGALATLRTDLANLAAQLLLYTPLSEFQKLIDIVSILWELAHRPAVYIYYGTERFLDESQSAVGTTLDGVYNAQVNEGLRFPGGGAGWVGPLQLLNPTEPVVVSYDGFILPRPSGSRVRYDCSFPDVESWLPVRLLSFTYHANFTCRHLSPARWRFRCGPHYLPSPQASVWWYEGQNDPTGEILSFTSETWPVTAWKTTVTHNEVSTVYWPRHGWDRWNHYWRDWVDVHYWAKIYNDFTHSGNHCAQSFYNAQDGWLTGITLYSHKQFYQELTVVITGCTEDGIPDCDNHTLRRVVLDASAIQTCYDQPIRVGDIVVGLQVADFEGPLGASKALLRSQGYVINEIQELHPGSFYRISFYGTIPAFVWPLRINFPPVFLQAGRHYSFHVHSTADHEFSFCDHDSAYQVHQGAFWHWDGSVFKRWGSGPRTLRFLAHFATWGRWGEQQSPGGQLHYEINFQPLQLAGGIGSVDVLAEAIVPAATDLDFAVQVGATWRKFDHDFSAFTGSDALLPFRVEFNGTTELMPGISLVNSQTTLTKAASPSLHHISKVITLGSASTSIKVVVRLQNYVEANHDLLIRLRYGATLNTTPVVAEDLLDDGTIIRKATFTTTSITTFQIELDGATNGVGPNFFVSERIVYAT